MPPTQPTQRLVVIGNGMAGAHLIEEIRARDGSDDFEIVMFGDEPYGNYNRILLSGVLAGSHDPQDIFINPLRWYADHDVTLHAGVRVTAIDVEARIVHGESSINEPFDRLVIATGSTPFIPPMAGLDDASGARKPGIFVFRTLDDCEAMIAYAGAAADRGDAPGARTAAVIGGGLLGLEAARGLQAQGLDVHVVHLMPWLMESQLDATAGAVLHQTLEGMGVHVHLEALTTDVLGDERVTGLRFKDGSTLDMRHVGHRCGHPPERRACAGGRPAGGARPGDRG